MIIGLVPARSGSKGVPNKNIRPFAGYPLMAWSIVASRLSEVTDNTVVSTDSEEYAQIARRYGAEVLMRPPELAIDTADDSDYLLHFLENYDCKWIVLLRPTTPLRDPQDITDSWWRVKCHSEHTSLRSMHQLREPYEKMGHCPQFNTIKYSGKSWMTYYEPISVNGDCRRQDFSPTYHPNGYVDVLKASVVKNGLLYGNRVVPFDTGSDPGEIDREEDFDYLEWRLRKYGCQLYDYLREYYTPETQPV